MPENNPIPDAELAEVKRLRAAATPGELRSVGYRLSHSLNTRIEYNVEHLEELGQTRYGAPYQAIPFARQEDATWHAAMHNAFPGLLARLEAAERERDEVEAELEEERANSIEYEKDCTKALCSLAREFDYEWDGDGATADDLREFISTTLDELTKQAQRLREGGE